MGGACVAIVAGGVAAAPDGGDDADGGATAAGSSGEGNQEGGGTSQASPSPSGADAASGVSGTFDGPVVTNIRGDYQVRLTFDNGVLTAVDYPVAGTDAAESRRINQQALPELTEEFLEEQTWDVEYVSGASYTSPAMVESAEAAFEDAGL